MQAFTYSIYVISLNKYYYGVRKSCVFDLGTKYFSSSKLVKRLIQENGISDFDFKIRRKFNSYEEARRHETEFLQRVNAVKNPKMLNQAISAKHVPGKDSVSEKTRRENISKKMKELWQDKDYRERQNFLCLDSNEASRRGKLGAEKRAKNYKNGTTERKPPKIKMYKDVTIIKNGVTKIIKSNQVPQYKKSGWQRFGL